ncbi:unnamed protein product [Rhizoctonia solani]|uniref:Peptidase S33 tripeptidyl aminopeptidase-like C-terminal domain-containing protein n=1 Tax=Rhizoctonia solani TaxID=456999 RepID=A0A8H3BIR7_9AGAM|nr:unnamed protein product [Rhizoctonia solani]
MTLDKSPHLPIHSPTSPSEHSKSRPVWTCAALAFLAYHVYRHITLDALFPAATVANGIAWWPCPDITTTECAYLSVPRDYANPQANDTVSIFMRKVPATVARKDYLGSILINPGGPGGSGNAMAASWGPRFSAMLDGRYDIIGFDPRGVNMTTPKLGCYETETQAVHSMYKKTLLGVPYDSRGSSALPAGTRARMEHAYLTRLNATYTASSLACLENGNKPMLESVSTAFSYGTILGSTFAAMRPHLVKRMVLDGVSNAESYHNDIYQWGVDGLTDNRNTLEGFFDSCVEAGPDRCTFAKSPSGKVSTSGADLHSRLEALYARLRDEPVPVPKSSVGPGVLTASDLKQRIFRGLYTPKSWPVLARAIAEAEAGNPQLLYEEEYGIFEELKPARGDDNIFNRYMEKIGATTITAAIMCSDSEPAHKSLDQYAEYIHEMGQYAPIGEIWAMWTGFCASWKIRPGQKYDGPWSVEDGLKKTRFPILYTSLDSDPVTPLAAAQKMAKSFGNESAVLLVQEGYGHCTIAHPSLCTAKAIRDYFLNGKVPAPGTHCKPEPGYLFPGNSTKSISTLSTEDQQLWDALKGLEDMNTRFRHHL